MTSKSAPAASAPFWQPPERWVPHNYQKRSVKFLLTHGAAGLFLPPGLGKTAIVLAALKLLFKEKHVKKVLVVAPLRVCFSTWPGQIQKWADFNHLRCVVMHGDAGNKDELLKQDADLYIVNPEGLDWLLATKKTKTKAGKTSVEVDVRRFKRFGFDVLVLDELTKFKNHQADRFKALKKVLGTFGRRWGLTGSPAANGLEQLFGQMYCLDMGRSLGEFITHYRNKYFLPSPNGFGYVLAEGREEMIYERISPVVLRINEEDAGLDLPQLVVHDIWVDLPDDAMEAYKSMEKHLIAIIESQVSVAKNGGVALGKCRQLANGAIYKTPDVEALVKRVKSQREWLHLHDAKLEALEDLVESLQEKQIIISYEFGHDMERLEKIWKPTDGTRYVARTTPGKFKQLENDWNAGTVPRLIAQSASISHGLNLQESGHHIGMLGVPWDFEVYDQIIRRVRRQGSTAKRVFLHRILARGTVDEVMITTLGQKDRSQNNFFNALVRLRKKR